MNDNMLPPGCNMDNEPMQAYENMVNQIQAIMDDEEASCKIGGYEEALEKIGFTPLFKKDEVKEAMEKISHTEMYLDEDAEYLLIISNVAEVWTLYENVEWRNL